MIWVITVKYLSHAEQWRCSSAVRWGDRDNLYKYQIQNFRNSWSGSVLCVYMCVLGVVWPSASYFGCATKITYKKNWNRRRTRSSTGKLFFIGAVMRKRHHRVPRNTMLIHCRFSLQNSLRSWQEGRRSKGPVPQLWLQHLLYLPGNNNNKYFPNVTANFASHCNGFDTRPIFDIDFEWVRCEKQPGRPPLWQKLWQKSETLWDKHAHHYGK